MNTFTEDLDIQLNQIYYDDLYRTEYTGWIKLGVSHEQADMFAHAAVREVQLNWAHMERQERARHRAAKLRKYQQRLVELRGSEWLKRFERLHL